MNVQTTRFGPIDVDVDELVTFDDGLPGFPGERQMTLIGAGALPGAEAGDGHHTLFWLQDIGDPDLAFLTIVPWVAYPDYDIEVDADTVDGADVDDVSILAIVTVRREDGGVRLTSNLLAPIAIDVRRRVGHQLILNDPRWSITTPLVEARPSAPGDVPPLVAGSTVGDLSGC
jgi:flagellar assembly factor FliW